MRPGRYNLNLYRGDSYAWRFVLWTDADNTVPLDLTDVTPEAEIRTSDRLDVIELDCTIEEPNIVTVELGAAMWADWTDKRGVWDLQLTYATGEVLTVVAGTVYVTADVTDPAPIGAVMA